MTVKKWIAVFIFFNIGALLAEDEPIYQLVKHLKNADLDYEFIRNINSIELPFPKNSRFPVGDFQYKKGEFEVYKFQSVEFGLSSESDKKTITHKILILKTKNKKIIDGYHYTLEWQDVPSYALFKITKKPMLKGNLKLDELGLTPVEKDQSKNEYFPGVVDNTLGYQKLF